jgi:hypothetical protein
MTRVQLKNALKDLLITPDTTDSESRHRLALLLEFEHTCYEEGRESVIHNENIYYHKQP